LSDAFPREAKDIIRSKNHIKYDAMMRIFRQGQAEGTVKDHRVSEMATLFFSTMNGLALNKAIYGADFIMPDKNIILAMFLKEL
jgi:hypothetical protein